MRRLDRMAVSLGGAVRAARRALSKWQDPVMSFHRGYPRVLPGLWIVLLVVLAYFVGIRTSDPPTNVHSLGIVAQVVNDPATRGRTLPASERCAVCTPGSQLMQSTPGGGLRVDMVVSVHPRLSFPYPSCGAATVDMVVSGTQPFWQEHNRLGPGVLTRIAVGWDGASHLSPPPGATLPTHEHGSPALISFLSDPEAGLHPAYYTDGDLTAQENQYHNKVAWFPADTPHGVRTQILAWTFKRDRGRYSVVQYTLHLHFVANWLAPRGWGSCYVLLPSLLANGAIAGTQNAINALYDTQVTGIRQVALESEAQAPSYGRVALSVQGSLSLPDTSPAPTDFEAICKAGQVAHSSTSTTTGCVTLSEGRLGPVWACQPSDELTYLTARAPHDVPAAGAFAGNACGAVAVVNAANASDVKAVFLIIVGVLIALCFERALTGRAEKRDA